MRYLRNIFWVSVVVALFIVSAVTSLADTKKLDRFLNGNNFTLLAYEPQLHSEIIREDITIHKLVDAYFMGKGLLEQINLTTGSEFEPMDVQYMEEIYNDYHKNELKLDLAGREEYLSKLSLQLTDDQYTIKGAVESNDFIVYTVEFVRQDLYKGKLDDHYIEFTIMYDKESKEFVWDFDGLTARYRANDKLVYNGDETLKYIDLYAVLMYSVSK